MASAKSGATSSSKKLSPSAPPSSSSRSQPSFLISISLLLPYALGIFYLISRLHYDLPRPETPSSTSTGPPPLKFSEHEALRHVDYLSSLDEGGLGYRILGTEELVVAEEYVMQILEGYKEKLDLLKQEGKGNGKEVEIFKQTGSGAHLFDFMGERVWKKYDAIDNIIVRLSDGTEESKENAVLVSAHLDSTLPSPGAMDDLAGISIMLELVRIFSNPDSNIRLANSIVLLFNGGEESLQDASHLFITQHPLKKTIRAAINLEACGVSGPEIVFQATSAKLIKAYSKVPYPFGSISASEIFKSGVIVSDTDFRQFEEYGNLTGLDMAIIGDSYKYHTRLDVPSAAEPGVLEHFGANVIALLTELTKETSSLPSQAELSLPPSQRDPIPVFWSALGGKLFFVYSKRTALGLYISLLVGVVSFLGMGMSKKKTQGVGWRVYGTQTFAAFRGIIVATVMAQGVAAAMRAMGRDMSWFANEKHALFLYGPPAALGVLLNQLLVASNLRRGSEDRFISRQVLEHSAAWGQLLLYSFLAALGQAAGVGTSYVPAVVAFSLAIGLIGQDVVASEQFSISLPTYFVVQLFPFLLPAELLATILDIFVPLIGRLGPAPGDHILAGILPLMVLTMFPMLSAFSHRFGKKGLIRGCWSMAALSITMVIVFSFTWGREDLVFDKEHPKRVLWLFTENIGDITDRTVGNEVDWSLHVAGIDSASGMGTLLESAVEKVGLNSNELALNVMDDESRSGWDILYPVTQFLTTYKLPLALPPSTYSSPWASLFRVSAEKSSLWSPNHSRSLTIIIDHPEIIWTVITFEADVVTWDLPAEAGRGLRKYHVKEASGLGSTRWELSLSIALNDTQWDASIREEQRRRNQRSDASPNDRLLSTLEINFSGLDPKGMWPVAKDRETRLRIEEADQEQGRKRPGRDFLENVDKILPEWTDNMMLSAVAGKVRV